MKIWSLYKITNLVNNKVYIGQTTDINKRWSDHRRAAVRNSPTQIIHHAIIKYGLDKFQFENIASCSNQDDANYTETILVQQYHSLAADGYGYNGTLGGMNAPKSEEWRDHMSKIMTVKAKERWEKESPKDKEARYAKVSATLKGRPRIPGSGMKKGFVGMISPNRRFDETEIKLIRLQYAQGVSIRQIARNYQIDHSRISDIVKNKSYKNIK